MRHGSRLVLEINPRLARSPEVVELEVLLKLHWDQASKTAIGTVLQLSRLDLKKQQLGAGPFLG